MKRSLQRRQLFDGRGAALVVYRNEEDVYYVHADSKRLN